MKCLTPKSLEARQHRNVRATVWADGDDDRADTKASAAPVSDVPQAQLVDEAQLTNVRPEPNVRAQVIFPDDLVQVSENLRSTRVVRCPASIGPTSNAI